MSRPHEPHVLGIRPTAPGFRHWIVAPQPGGLVAGPRGTSGTVAVPVLGRRRVIAMEGRIVWDGRHACQGAHARRVRGAIAFPGIRGRHTFAWADRT